MADHTMTPNIKQPTTIQITGLHMTVARQQQVGQAVLIALAQQLDGDIDGVEIVFTESSTETP